MVVKALETFLAVCKTARLVTVISLYCVVENESPSQTMTVFLYAAFSVNLT